jgi:hypothetical protein
MSSVPRIIVQGFRVRVQALLQHVVHPRRFAARSTAAQGAPSDGSGTSPSRPRELPPPPALPSHPGPPHPDHPFAPRACSRCIELPCAGGVLVRSCDVLVRTWCARARVCGRKRCPRLPISAPQRRVGNQRSRGPERFATGKVFSKAGLGVRGSLHRSEIRGKALGIRARALGLEGTPNPIAR